MQIPFVYFILGTLGYILRSGIVGQMNAQFLDFLVMSILFSRKPGLLTILTSIERAFISPCIELFLPVDEDATYFCGVSFSL